ncbi:hypothetical protein [Pelomonas cellulosilytica]|uniref:DUF4034 domain-containing protein n=1 Tax=Pelomonas cellulosilytica TaxID=2906762 RepID=A0ABS8XU83_9BURK|nr:hypothetical protein [Pelomonas sp. P8]MCE4554442.1 hypothetical protein [Pelomonas sp. P8]
MQRRWLFVLPLLVLVAAVGFGVGRLNRPAAPAVPLAGVAASAASAASASAALVAVRSAPDAPQPAASADAEEARAREALKQRMKADWCGFGLAEQQRQRDAVMAGFEARTGGIGIEAIEAANETVGAQVQREAEDGARRRWVAALRRRGDPRSLAVADYLGGMDDADATGASARLQALARSSSDPMVTVLALLRPCPPGQCTNIQVSQWSRLEPANLQAWLMLLRESKGPERRSLVPYALERMAAEGRFSRMYEREFTQLLLELPQTETPGLAHDAEVTLLIGVASVWPIAGYAPLTQACADGLTDAATRRRCEAVAELLWLGDTVIEHGLALSLARRLSAADTAVLARWQARARVYEATLGWTQAAFLREAERLERVSPCAASMAWRALVRDRARLGEWGAARAEMAAQRADDQALSSAWRAQGGRPVLDAAAPEASAVTR